MCLVMFDPEAASDKSSLFVRFFMFVGAPFFPILLSPNHPFTCWKIGVFPPASSGSNVNRGFVKVWEEL